MHSPVHEKVIFCQFLTFLEALKVVGLALHKFEDVIRTFEHKEMGCRGKNGEIGQFLAELVFWLSCKISLFTIHNHTNGAADSSQSNRCFSFPHFSNPKGFLHS